MQSHTFKYMLIFLICASASFLTGCKGSASKRVATEAVEMLGGKGAASAESAIEREASQVERSVAKEAESNNSWSRRRIRPRHNSFDDDEDETSDEPQVYTVSCSQCGGSGAVYMLDYYGNVQYDFYGNPMVTPCSYCSGSGTILVSE